MRGLTLLHAERRDVIGRSVAGRGISTAECSWTTMIGQRSWHVKNYKIRIMSLSKNIHLYNSTTNTSSKLQVNSTVGNSCTAAF